MKKIAYIELDTHAEIAQNFMELMCESKRFQVDYFFSQKILKRVGEHQKNIFVTEPSELLSQLKKQHYDLVVIGTAHRYFNVFEAICENFNTAVIVHNLNFSKISRWQLFKNLFKKDFKYRLKLLLKEDLLSAPNVYKKAKNLFVLDEFLANENFGFLPVFYSKYFFNHQNEHLKIVIPGGVSQKRRDYLLVLKKLKSFKNPTEVTMLGKASGKELKWLQNFESDKVKLKFFTEKVPQNIFDKEMNSADVLWCPVQRETEFFSQKEIYGVTKMSGNVGDAIKYGKFAVFPGNFKNEYPFIIEAEKDLETQFSTLKRDYDFKENFNKEKIQALLENALESALS